MLHYLYKTKNKVNGKYYIGRHSTTKIDNYFGSGTVLKRAIEKYGLENFQVEILEYFDSYESLIEAEKKMIDSILFDPMSYNVSVGGEGGSHKSQWTNERRNKHGQIMLEVYKNNESREKISESISKLHEKTGKLYWSEEGIESKKQKMKGNKNKLGKKESEETRIKKSIAHKGKPVAPFSELHKEKISSNRKGKGMGDRNAMASAEAREKVAASKRGRKRVYREDGSFYMSKVN